MFCLNVYLETMSEAEAMELRNGEESRVDDPESQQIAQAHTNYDSEANGAQQRALDATRTYKLLEPDSCCGKCVIFCGFSLFYAFGAITFMLLPLTLVSARQAHVSEVQMHRDALIMEGLPSFRDIPWEMWSFIHEGLKEVQGIYVAITAFLYSCNLYLWYWWFTRRYFFDRQAYFMITLYILLLFSFLGNFLNWLPPPADYIQDEPLWVTYFFGFVIPEAHSYFTPRVSFSIILLHDRLSQTEDEVDGCVRWTMIGGYAVLSVLYLWSTRQIYSSSLILNIIVALAASQATLWVMQTYAYLMRLCNARARRRARRVEQHFGLEGPVFSVDSEDEQGEDEQENDARPRDGSDGGVGYERRQPLAVAGARAKRKHKKREQQAVELAHSGTLSGDL